MHIFQTVVLVLFLISSALLIFMILIQSGKGGSLGIMGGGSSSSAFGSSTVDVVEKISWWGALAFFVLAILAAIAFADSGPKIPENVEKDSIEKQLQVPATDPATQGQPSGQNPPVMPGTVNKPIENKPAATNPVTKPAQTQPGATGMNPTGPATGQIGK